MTYSLATRLDSPPQGGWTRSAVFREARRRGMQTDADLTHYLDVVYGQSVLNPEIVAIQSAHETAWWTSHWWETRRNPAGIGITGDPEQNDHSRTFRDGDEAARAQLAHLGLYAFGTKLPANLPTTRDLDPRWDAAVAAGYAGRCSTIGALTGTWAVDPDYGDKLVAILNSRSGPSSPLPKEKPVMATHKYILSAGHRNENRGGARGEIDWTYGSVVALKAEIEARGGQAWIVQEHDGDSDDTFCRGRGLQNAARRCVELANEFGPFDAYISSHYNGGGSPGFHAIFPDAHNGIDVKRNNPLDLRLCRKMRDRVKSTNTVNCIAWTADSAGVMSEQETGVGAQGYRLGEFVGTLGFREHTARVIIEAGSIDTFERKYIQNPAWVRDVYVPAIVDALADEFGAFPVTDAGKDTGEAAKPETVYAEAKHRPWLETLRETKQPVKSPDGVMWYPVFRMYRALEEADRKQLALESARDLNEPVPAGTVAMMDAIGLNSKGDAWLASAWDTMFIAHEWEPVAWPEGPDLQAA